MSPAFIKRMNLGTQPLQKPRKIWNIDNTENKDGLITHYLELNVQTKGVRRDLRFLVTNIGNEDIVLGYPWLATFEPQFNWTNAVIRCYDPDTFFHFLLTRLITLRVPEPP